MKLNVDIDNGLRMFAFFSIIWGQFPILFFYFLAKMIILPLNPILSHLVFYVELIG